MQLNLCLNTFPKRETPPVPRTLIKNPYIFNQPQREFDCIVSSARELKQSPDQTDSPVVASSRKLNLRRDLRWVAKLTPQFPRWNASQETHSKAYLSCTPLANKRLMDVTRLASTCVQI